MSQDLQSLWEELETDRSRGSTELAHYVLTELLDEVEKYNDEADSSREDIVRNLRERRPEMTLLVNLGHALNGGLDDPYGQGSGSRLREDLRILRDRLDQSARRIAASLRASPLPLESPVVFSRSGSVVNLLYEVAPSGTVTVLESHPGDEGIGVANELADRFDVRFRYDLGALPAFRTSDLLLLGADSYDGNGRIRNKVGSELLARASGDVPVVSCFQTMKFEASDEPSDGPEHESPRTLDEDLQTGHPLFEWVSADAVDYYATDAGCFDTVERLRAQTRSLRTARKQKDHPS